MLVARVSSSNDYTACPVLPARAMHVRSCEALCPQAIVLLALASSAYADSNSVQADEILAENVRLKAEIALLKARSARSESKIAQQAAEIVQLNARLRAKRVCGHV